MSERSVMAVAGREFRSYFDQATAYILLVVFLAANFFFFFRTAFITGEATLRPMFELLPWLLLFFIPAVTMRSLAEERSRGTLELVLAQPIREVDFLLGKFLGIMGFMAVALAGTLGAVLALRLGGDPYAGVLVAQYTGALMLAAALVAVGLWASSLTRNQITAFIIAIAVTFTLMAISLDVVLIGLPPLMAAAATRLGLLTHFASITRGVLDLRDAVYFLTLTGGFLALAYLALQRTRLNPKGRTYRTLRLGVLGILGICVLVNLLGRHIRGRLDLTPGKAYTLSGTTKSVLAGLEDVVTLKFFASPELPPQVDIVKRDIEDLLADYASAAGDNLQLLAYSPAADNEDRVEAERLGIPSIQFNVLGQEEFQVKQGYLGIAIQYADELHTLPFVRQAEDLEYRLTSAIVNMTDPSSTTIGFLTGHGEHDISGELAGLAGQLRETYGVVATAIAEDTAAIPDSVGVLVVPGPRTPLSPEEGRKLRGFLERGGNMLLMLQQVAIDETRMYTTPQPHPVLDSLLALYDARVAEGLLADLRSNGRVTVPGRGGFSFVLPYPLWPVALPSAQHAIVERLTGVLMAWASPLDLSRADSSSAVVLLSTSEFGGHLTGAFPLNPQFDFRSAVAGLAPQPLAAALLPPARPGRDAGTGAGDGESAGGNGSSPRGRVIVVGDADFAMNRFLSANPENLLFLQNAIDWLAEDESLIGIRSKVRQAPALIYSSAAARDAAKYGNLVGVPLLFVLVGALRLVRRRNLHSKPYRPPPETGHRSPARDGPASTDSTTAQDEADAGRGGEADR